MSTEQFANSAQSTLAAAVTAGAASLTVAGAAAFPSSGNFRLLIDSEILLVTAVSGNTFTVSRGQEGTTAAAHTYGTYATHVLTAGALTGHFASLETANTYLALNTFGPGLISSPFGSGSNNEAFGAGAGRSAATGSNNTVVGQAAGASLTSGSSNVFVGQKAGNRCDQGGNNVGVGVQALQSLTSGTDNFGFGVNCLNNVTTGSHNVAIGTSAAVNSGTSIDGVVAIGYQAGQGVSGNNNVGLGGQVLGASGAGTSSAQNAALGTRALKNVSTGGDNTGAGYQAGQTISTGAQNTLVGSGADVGSGSLSNTLGLGYSAKPTASNEAALGPYLNELTLHQLSSTSTDRPAAEIDWLFATATDASRKGRLSLGAHDALTSVGGPREGVRVESDGTQALLGFYGVTAVARAVLATGAGHTVDDVITALQNLGLVKQS